MFIKNNFRNSIATCLSLQSLSRLQVSHASKMICLLALGFFVGCTDHNEHHEESHLGTTHPWRQSVDLSQSYVGQIKASQHIEIRAFEKGYLQKIYVDEGQFIKKGQKMFQIMPSLVQAEYDKTKAEFEVSKIELSNTQTLADKKVVSPNELALAKARFDKSKASTDLARTHVNLTTISAPFDGLMDKFRVRLGSLVEEGELLTTLSDNRELWVYFNVTERDYLIYMKNKVKTPGANVARLKLADGSFYAHDGKIDTIEADFDNQTGNVAFRASFANPEGLLRHGETGTIVLTEKIDNALLIPQKATFDVLDKKYVYVIKDGKAETREITIDKEMPHLFIIKSGLTEQDLVLIEGIGRVNKGQAVKTKVLAMDDVMKSLQLKAN